MNCAWKILFLAKRTRVDSLAWTEDWEDLSSSQDLVTILKQQNQWVIISTLIVNWYYHKTFNALNTVLINQNRSFISILSKLISSIIHPVMTDHQGFVMVSLHPRDNYLKIFSFTFKHTCRACFARYLSLFIFMSRL